MVKATYTHVGCSQICGVKFFSIPLVEQFGYYHFQMHGPVTFKLQLFTGRVDLWEGFMFYCVTN